MSQFDLIVIGGGPGGYVAAIRGAQLGMTVAVVEKRKVMGGTCLNVGCIPSKALLDSSEHYHQAKENFATHGIKVTGLKVDLAQMMQRKSAVVDATTKGVDFLMKKHNIAVFNGLGSLASANTVVVNSGKKTAELSGKRIIIATGSEPSPLPSVPTDGKHIITSDEAISLSAVPKEFVVIGGGVIGLELGSVYARLGSRVTVVEFMDRLIPTMDKQLGKSLERSLKKLGMTFHLKTKVTGASVKGKTVTLTAEDGKGNDIKMKADKVLVAIGRRPFTEGLGLEALGVVRNERGFIQVNAQFESNVPGIYAIGDVIPGPMLAHKASEEGVACVEMMAGQKPQFDHHTIPGVVYTWPEVASVGPSEEELKAQGIAYKAGSFPFKASGRARASEEGDGFVKVLSDEASDEILAVHMIGPRAADMIGEAVVAMTFRASAEDIGALVHAHPTFSEALKEAALASTEDRPIHI